VSHSKQTAYFEGVSEEILWRMFGHYRKKILGGWTSSHNESSYLYVSRMKI